MELIKTQGKLIIEDSPEVGFSNVYIIQKIVGEEPTNVTYLISPDGGLLNMAIDGYYVIHKYKLPTTVNTEYYIIGGNSYGPGEELLEGQEIYSILDYETLEYSQIEFLYYENIKVFYINLLKDKYLKNLCCCGNLQDKFTVDTITMGLEVISYLEEYSQFYEAARIIDMLALCNKTVLSNCGCNG
jgi:hypothetical protein